MADLAAISAAVSCYGRDEYPALAAQQMRWCGTRPLAGLRVLDATPLFRNTMVKYLALLAGGAELTAGYGNGIPFDPSLPPLLESCGIPCRVNGTPPEADEPPFDMIFDCGGANRTLDPVYGVVELTRSGAHYYENSPHKVFLADAGRVKLIETALGTGDGLVRGLCACGIKSDAGIAVTVFGAGKVGRGILFNLLVSGCRCGIVDAPEQLKNLPVNVEKISRFDHDAVNKLVSSSDIIITATGIAGSMTEYPALPEWAAGKQIFANMGVEDEFGAEIPAERVLNAKAPLNFLLEEPTLLRYIDPTMALSNMGALALRSGKLRPGLNMPDEAVEAEILADVRHNGIISKEISRWEEMCGNE